VQRASGIPCALFIFEGERFQQDSGAMRRGIANTHPVVIARLAAFALGAVQYKLVYNFQLQPRGNVNKG
jgi:hypothetical protein